MSSSESDRRCCLICCSDAVNGVPQLSLSNSSTTTAKLTKATQKIFQCLLLPQEHFQKVKDKNWMSFCSKCIVIVDKIIELQRKAEILELEIQWKVETLARFAIDTSKVSPTHHGSKGKVVAEVCSVFKAPIIRNFRQGLLPNPCVRLKKVNVETEAVRHLRKPENDITLSVQKSQTLKSKTNLNIKNSITKDKILSFTSIIDDESSDCSILQERIKIKPDEDAVKVEEDINIISKEDFQDDEYDSNDDLFEVVTLPRNEARRKKREADNKNTKETFELVKNVEMTSQHAEVAGCNTAMENPTAISSTNLIPSTPTQVENHDYVLTSRINSWSDNRLTTLTQKTDYFECPSVKCSVVAQFKTEDDEKQTFVNAVNARKWMIEHYRTSRDHFQDRQNILSSIFNSSIGYEAVGVDYFKCTKCEFKTFSSNQKNQVSPSPIRSVPQALLFHFLEEHLFPWGNLPGLYKYGCYKAKCEGEDVLKCVYSHCDYSIPIQHDLEGKTREECEQKAYQYQSFKDKHGLNHNFNSVSCNDVSVGEVSNVKNSSRAINKKSQDCEKDEVEKNSVRKKMYVPSCVTKTLTTPLNPNEDEDMMSDLESNELNKDLQSDMRSSSSAESHRYDSMECPQESEEFENSATFQSLDSTSYPHIDDSRNNDVTVEYKVWLGNTEDEEVINLEDRVCNDSQENIGRGEKSLQVIPPTPILKSMLAEPPKIIDNLSVVDTVTSALSTRDPRPSEVTEQDNMLIEERDCFQCPKPNARLTLSLPIMENLQNLVEMQRSSNEKLTFDNQSCGNSNKESLTSLTEGIDYFACPFRNCGFVSYIYKEGTPRDTLRNAIGARRRIIDHYKTSLEHSEERKDTSNITHQSVVFEGVILRFYKCTKCQFKVFLGKNNEVPDARNKLAQRALAALDHFLEEHLFPWENFPGLYKYGCYQDKYEGVEFFKCIYSNCYFSTMIEYNLEGKSREECVLGAYHAFIDQHSRKHHFNSISVSDLVCVESCEEVPRAEDSIKEVNEKSQDVEKDYEEVNCVIREHTARSSVVKTFETSFIMDKERDNRPDLQSDQLYKDSQGDLRFSSSAQLDSITFQSSAATTYQHIDATNNDDVTVEYKVWLGDTEETEPMNLEDKVSDDSQDCVIIEERSSDVNSAGTKDLKETSVTLECGISMGYFIPSIPRSVDTSVEAISTPADPAERNGENQNNGFLKIRDHKCTKCNFRTTTMTSLTLHYMEHLQDPCRSPFNSNAEDENENTSSPYQLSFVVENQRRDSIENQRRVSIENQRQISIEHQRRVSIENQRRASIENQRQISIENQRRVSIENQRRASVESQRRASVESQRRASIENHRRAYIENVKLTSHTEGIDYFACPIGNCTYEAYIKKEGNQKQQLRNAVDARRRIIEHYRTSLTHAADRKETLSCISDRSTLFEDVSGSFFKCTKCEFKSFLETRNKKIGPNTRRILALKALTAHFLQEHVFPWENFPGLYKNGCYPEKREGRDVLKCAYSNCDYFIEIHYDLDGKTREESEQAADLNFVVKHARNHNFNSISYEDLISADPKDEDMTPKLQSVELFSNSQNHLIISSCPAESDSYSSMGCTQQNGQLDRSLPFQSSDIHMDDPSSEEVTVEYKVWLGNTEETDDRIVNDNQESVIAEENAGESKTLETLEYDIGRRLRPVQPKAITSKSDVNIHSEYESSDQELKIDSDPEFQLSTDDDSDFDPVPTRTRPKRKKYDVPTENINNSAERTSTALATNILNRKNPDFEENEEENGGKRKRPGNFDVSNERGTVLNPNEDSGMNSDAKSDELYIADSKEDLLSSSSTESNSEEKRRDSVDSVSKCRKRSRKSARRLSTETKKLPEGLTEGKDYLKCPKKCDFFTSLPKFKKFYNSHGAKAFLRRQLAIHYSKTHMSVKSDFLTKTSFGEDCYKCTKCSFRVINKTSRRLVICYYDLCLHYIDKHDTLTNEEIPTKTKTPEDFDLKKLKNLTETVDYFRCPDTNCKFFVLIDKNKIGGRSPESAARLRVVHHFDLMHNTELINVLSCSVVEDGSRYFKCSKCEFKSVFEKSKREARKVMKSHFTKRHAQPWRILKGLYPFKFLEETRGNNVVIRCSYPGCVFFAKINYVEGKSREECRYKTHNIVRQHYRFHDENTKPFKDKGYSISLPLYKGNKKFVFPFVSSSSLQEKCSVEESSSGSCTSSTDAGILNPCSSQSLSSVENVDLNQKPDAIKTNSSSMDIERIETEVCVGSADDIASEDMSLRRSKRTGAIKRKQWNEEEMLTSEDETDDDCFTIDEESTSEDERCESVEAVATNSNANKIPRVDDNENKKFSTSDTCSKNSKYPDGDHYRCWKCDYYVEVIYRSNRKSGNCCAEAREKLSCHFNGRHNYDELAYHDPDKLLVVIDGKDCFRCPRCDYYEEIRVNPESTVNQRLGQKGNARRGVRQHFFYVHCVPERPKSPILNGEVDLSKDYEVTEVQTVVSINVEDEEEQENFS